MVYVEVELNNPGIWALHCHSGQHASEGMMQLIQVAEQLPRNPEGWTTKQLTKFPFFFFFLLCVTFNYVLYLRKSLLG